MSTLRRSISSTACSRRCSPRSACPCVAAGLLSYTAPVEATPRASDLPAVVTDTPSPSPLLTFPPFCQPQRRRRGRRRPPGKVVATRVVVPALGIDLPVIRQPGGADAFPPCDVAMYLQQLRQPGQPGATYLYAHARTGMFLPILEASKINNGKRTEGMLVQVYTSDDQLFLYEIVEVRRHVTTLDAALAEKRETLWLQTSEGPAGRSRRLRSSPCRSARPGRPRGGPPEGEPGLLPLTDGAARARTRRPADARSSRSGGGRRPSGRPARRSPR